MWKKVVKAVAVVAVVAVVVAMVVVAAPAVVAAVGGASATVAVGGATAGATLAGAAASGASALLGTTLAIAGATAIGATCVAITEHVRTLTDKKFEERVDVATRELKKKYPDELMYRAQTLVSINRSLTPRGRDIDGLSFFDTFGLMVKKIKSYHGVFITAKPIIEPVGFSVHGSEGHYSVMPIPATKLPEWQSTYDTAETNPHKFTEIIRSVCVYVAI